MKRHEVIHRDDRRRRRPGERNGLARGCSFKSTLKNSITIMVKYAFQYLVVQKIPLACPYLSTNLYGSLWFGLCDRTPPRRSSTDP